MRRRLIKLCVFILAGAIVNVAVAWGYWLPMHFKLAGYSVRRLSETEARSIWDQNAPADWPISEDVQGFKIQSVAYDVDSVEHGHGYKTPAALDLSIVRCREGWPCRSMRSIEAFVFDSPEPLSARLVTKIEFTAGSDELTALHVNLVLTPLWPGFAINTLFYAAILWLPFAGFRFVRRRIRTRRGQCPACAYPIGTSDVCTECGRTLPSPSR